MFNEEKITEDVSSSSSEKTRNEYPPKCFQLPDDLDRERSHGSHALHKAQWIIDNLMRVES